MLQFLSRAPALLAFSCGLLLAACSDTDNPTGTNPPASNPAPLPAFATAQRDFIEDSIAVGEGGSYGGLIHIAEGVRPVANSFDAALARLNSREDTADFALPGLLTLMHRYADSPALDATLKEAIEAALINFKYWPDELAEVPGTTDANNLVTWTENHYILFSAGAYLAGQLYPERVFPASGRKGSEQMAVYRPRILKWLELRYRSGFSEWLSYVYYNEDIPALLALVELAEDEEIAARAEIVLDLLFADMALNHFQGNFGSTHGRTYSQKMDGSRDSTRGVMHLVWGLNRRDTGNMSASMMALAQRYRVPEVLERIALDSESAVMENRQRMGIRLEEAAEWGLSLERIEDGMSLLTMEPYAHPLFADTFYQLLNLYQWWDHRDFQPFNDYRLILDDPEARAAAATTFEWDLTRNMRPEVNIYSYRTPSYLLSTAQDWRKGFGGDQASIWQATLGMQAVAFTTHPANESRDGPTPNYWVGYGTLPRAAQVKNVVVSLYDIETRDGLYYSDQPLYTHAFLPRARFDQSLQEGQWFFARQGEAYLALWSSDPEATWEENRDGQYGGESYEIIARGEKTIWICELGDARQYGDFSSFQDAILAAALQTDSDTLELHYSSPSQGEISMGWEGPVLHNGVALRLDNYPRYENPWSESPFPATSITFRHADSYLELDFDEVLRRASGYLQ